MDRPYATAEQYERWFMVECARCGRRGHSAGSWPDGRVCRTCVEKAVRTRGTCPGCSQERALPGRRPGDDAPLCAGCAGFTQSFDCSRCGFEDVLHRGRLCTRCTLADHLDDLLDDGTGQVRPALVPLRERLLAAAEPKSVLTWARTQTPSRLLRGMGRGDVELTHEAFHTLKPWQAAAYLRELLMACAVLPTLDKHIASFERWLTAFLPGVTDPDHARVLRQFTTWQVLPWLRRRAELGPLRPTTRRHAGSQVKQAAEFLDWLSENDLALHSCTSASLDRWHIEHLPHERRSLRPFLQWAIRTRAMPPVPIPVQPTRSSAPLSQHRRLTLLRKVLHDDTITLRTRVAAGLVLLYAQPLTRIVRLTTGDVLLDDGEVLLRLGTPPVPVPDPLAGLLQQLRDDRANMRTATNPDSAWLFPGRRAGQPLRPETLGEAMRSLGLPTTAARTAALRQLVLQAPAPVIADSLGFHPSHTTRVVTEAGGTWSRYAPSIDHPQ